MLFINMVCLTVALAFNMLFCGEFHDQGDAKWIVIRLLLLGHNDTPFGWPTPGRPIGCPGSGRPQGLIGVFQLLFINVTYF
jgi:hypothetical protein